MPMVKVVTARTVNPGLRESLRAAAYGKSFQIPPIRLCLGVVYRPGTTLTIDRDPARDDVRSEERNEDAFC